MHRWPWLIVLLLLTGGCAHQRLAGRSCPLKLHPIVTRATAQSVDATGFATELQTVLAAPARVDHLVLSGGGKWGAFGSGFLAAWPGRPVFKVVTGVSTGALQGTFALLGDEAVPAGRVYPPALDFDAVPPGPRRYVDDLVEAYSITRSDTLLKSYGGLTSAVRRGSTGDLAPLRVRLDALIDAPTFARVAAAHAAGRRFYAAMADMDGGGAVAVDMTALAARGAAEPANSEAYRQCYLDVLIAAASEPLAAQPVFLSATEAVDGKVLGNRMYMDAGLRHGVFLEEVLDAAGTGGISAVAETPRIVTTVIVNGEQRVDDLTTPDRAGDKWQREWSLLTLAGRARELLVNQIYDFSLRRVRSWSEERGGVQLVFVRDAGPHRWNGQSCDQWRAADKAAKQDGFPPQFMRCLIDYGRARGAQGDWDVALATPLTPP